MGLGPSRETDRPFSPSRNMSSFMELAAWLPCSKNVGNLILILFWIKKAFFNTHTLVWIGRTRCWIWQTDKGLSSEHHLVLM